MGVGGISGYCGQILHLPQNHIGQQVIRLDLQAVLIHYTGKVVVPDVGDEGPSRGDTPYCAVTGQYKPNVYLHAENDAESTGQPNRCPPPGHPRCQGASRDRAVGETAYPAAKSRRDNLFR